MYWEVSPTCQNSQTYQTLDHDEIGKVRPRSVKREVARQLDPEFHASVARVSKTREGDQMSQASVVTDSHLSSPVPFLERMINKSLDSVLQNQQNLSYLSLAIPGSLRQ